MDGSRYLSGNLAPVSEEITAFDLEVEGTIPAELDGRYLRNGPNPIGQPDPSRHHWFTGDGMVHGIRLRGGKALWYRNRWVRSPAVAAALGEETPPSKLPPDRPVYAANTNVIGHAGRTYAIVEAGSVPIELTGELDTIGPSDFDGTLPWAFTAHPKRDPVTGDLHAVAYWWGWGNRVQYLVVGADGRVRCARDVELAAPGSPMMHDMSITQTRAVLFDLPCIFDLEAAKAGWPMPYRWNEANGARVGVLDKDGEGPVTWIDVEPCYVFHPLNAYDVDDGRLVVDVVRHPSMFATDVHGPSEGPPTLDRWTIDPRAGKVLEERLDDRPQEFPRVDERLVGRRARYGYAVASDEDSRNGKLLRHDLRTMATEVHDYGAGRSTMEAVFVPRSDDSAEDDGWVMSVVHDETTDRGELVILDARDISADPVARVLLPARVPYGFHGNWVPTTLA
jgi:carotenoid cleavage dioxygenase